MSADLPELAPLPSLGQPDTFNSDALTFFASLGPFRTAINNLTADDFLPFSVGSAAAPSISFAGDADTGIYSPGAGKIAFSTDGTTRTSIDQGALLHAQSTTAQPGFNNTTIGMAVNAAGQFFCSSQGGSTGHFNVNQNGTATAFLRAGAIVGSVAVTATGTSYNTSSDYRLKTDVQDMTDALDRLADLRPVNFEWISDGTRVDGFLAHEAAETVPEAVTGEKDAVDADGEPIYQGIDQAKLVPLLTAALQEAVAKIDALETRVAALEGA